MKTTAEVMTLLTNGRPSGTLSQKQASWVLGVWTRDASQPEPMTTPGGWNGSAYVSRGDGTGWYVWFNRYNCTVTFKVAA